MYFNHHLSLTTLSLLLPFPSTTSSSPITPTTPININTPTHPLLIYSLPDISNFALVDAWPAFHPRPSWLRPIDPNTATTLLSSAIYALSALPGSEISNAYRSFGPESNRRLAALDTRVIVRQYKATNLTSADVGENAEGGVDVKASPKAAPMRNQEVVAATAMVQRMYAAGAVKEEWAGVMCYLSGDDDDDEMKVGVGKKLDRCTGLVMVQRDLWWQ
ncbi:MAG: hypothetical protein LQ338_003548 [Usnochroma carphineum]|nr:MAG: hypothetical protein LQ338_003548 [Usnochroma carphineum]